MKGTRETKVPENIAVAGRLFELRGHYSIRSFMSAHVLRNNPHTSAQPWSPIADAKAKEVKVTDETRAEKKRALPRLRLIGCVLEEFDTGFRVGIVLEASTF